MSVPFFHEINSRPYKTALQVNFTRLIKIPLHVTSSTFRLARHTFPVFKRRIRSCAAVDGARERPRSSAALSLSETSSGERVVIFNQLPSLTVSAFFLPFFEDFGKLQKCLRIEDPANLDQRRILERDFEEKNTKMSQWTWDQSAQERFNF